MHTKTHFMTTTTIFIIVLIILVVILFLGVWNFIPIGQPGINKLFFVIIALLVLLSTLQVYGVLRLR